MAELRAGPGLGQGPSHPSAFPGATLSLAGSATRPHVGHTSAWLILPGRLWRKTPSLVGPGVPLPCPERPGPWVSREGAELGHGMDSPCLFQRN